MANKADTYKIVAGRYPKSSRSDIPIIDTIGISISSVTDWMPLTGVPETEFMMLSLEDGEALVLYRTDKEQTIVRSAQSGRAAYRFHVRDLNALIQYRRFQNLSTLPRLKSATTKDEDHARG